MLLALAVIAQLADLVTLDTANELNPLASSPLALVAKGLLVVVIIAGNYAVGRRWRGVLLVAVAVGIVGFASNVLAWL